MDLKLEGHLISGLSFDPMNEYEEWVEFVVDLEKRDIKGGSWRQYEFKTAAKKVQLMHKNQQVKRRWWKIW